MSSNIVVLFVVFGLCGLFLGLIGNSIKKKQSINSIALPGLSARKVKDKKGLAIFVGNGLIQMGIISLLMGGSIFILPPLKVWVLLTFLVALIANFLRLVLGIRNYQEK
jgi:hypothetical protein